MNATNQIISWNRFTATLRKELAENWRTLVLVSLGIFLWYTITMTISNLTNMSGSYTINPLVFTFVAAILAGMSFRRLTTTTGRVDLFSSPSSTAEKFISNLLIYVIGAFVIFVVSFQLADVARYVIMSFFNHKLGIESTAPTNLIESIKTIRNHTQENDMIIIAVAVETGSVLWPRRSVIKMATVLLSLTLVKLIVLAISLYNKYGDNIDLLPDNMLNNFMNKAITVNLWIDAVIYVGCFILAWYTIKHKDVITVKWWK